jgi:AcrR family transcriptional regulator
LVHVTALGGPRPALQKRSEATLAAITGAALKLLATKDIDEISIAEIAHEAGIAVGTIYRRFESKEALVAHLLTLVQEKQVRELEALLSAPKWEGKSVEERVRWLRDQLTNTANAAPGLLRAIFGHVITGKDRLADFAREQDKEVLRLLCQWLLGAHPGTPDQREQAVASTALATFVHAVYMALLYPFSYAGRRREDVVAELEAGLLAHLDTVWR